MNRKVSLFSVKEEKPPKSAKFKVASNKDAIKEIQEAEESRPRHPSSIYGVIAAQKASKELKERSKQLMVQVRKRGDWGEYEITHAWSPEDFIVEDYGSRSSRIALEREMTGASDYLVTMARPYLMTPIIRFQPERVTPIIRETLEENLQGHVYNGEFCRQITTKITDQLKDKIKRLRYPRYKFICHAIVGEISNQDARAVSRCTWDTCADGFAQYEFRDFTIYGIGLVYAIYCE